MKKALIVTTVKITFKGFLIPHIKELEEMGYSVELACNMKGGPEIEELKGNKWHHVSFSRNPMSLNNSRAICELWRIKKKGYNLVHFHTPIAAFLGRVVARSLGIKNIIYTAHGFHFYDGAPLFNWLLYYPLEYIAMRWTDKIITINQEDFERAKSMSCKRTRVYKIDGVGLDIEKYSKGNKEKVRKELKLSEKDYIITIIGELNKNKNQIQLLKTAEMLEENYKVLVVGTGEKERKLKQYVKKRNMENKVKFLGFRNDINDIISASDVLVSMSYREGLPRSIMEGLAQGKPFIVTNVRGNRDLIENEVNGFLVGVGDYKKTFELIRRLSFNKNLCKNIEKNNLNKIREYSIEKVLKKLNKIYGRIN